MAAPEALESTDLVCVGDHPLAWSTSAAECERCGLTSQRMLSCANSDACAFKTAYCEECVQNFQALVASDSLTGLRGRGLPSFDRTKTEHGKWMPGPKRARLMPEELRLVRMGLSRHHCYDYYVNEFCEAGPNCLNVHTPDTHRLAPSRGVFSYFCADFVRLALLDECPSRPDCAVGDLSHVLKLFFSDLQAMWKKIGQLPGRSYARALLTQGVSAEEDPRTRPLRQIPKRGESTRVCVECGRRLPESNFSALQLSRGTSEQLCKVCASKHESEFFDIILKQLKPGVTKSDVKEFFSSAFDLDATRIQILPLKRTSPTSLKWATLSLPKRAAASPSTKAAILSSAGAASPIWAKRLLGREFYVEDKAEKLKTTTCMRWATRGRCEYGDSCWFLHTTEDTQRAPSEMIFETSSEEEEEPLSWRRSPGAAPVPALPAPLRVPTPPLIPFAPPAPFAPSAWTLKTWGGSVHQKTSQRTWEYSARSPEKKDVSWEFSSQQPLTPGEPTSLSSDTTRRVALKSLLADYYRKQTPNAKRAHNLDEIVDWIERVGFDVVDASFERKYGEALSSFSSRLPPPGLAPDF